MPNNDDITEIKEQLNNIQDDVNDIQGDVRVMSTLNKELNDEELVNRIHDSFGSSDRKKITWYYANNERTIQEIADEAGIPRGSVDWAVRELNKSGWLVEHHRNGNTIYAKAEVSKNLGVEGDLEDELHEL
jgi:predicted transcriptional regulator